MGYSNPTPIQEQAIPLVLEGRDVIAAAKTGTGKTAAFSLPCMDKLPHRERGQRGPFMLVITPTRELASQISDTCMPIGKHTRHFIGTFVGGVSYDPQIRKLERGLDVAIATPGRLIDLMERGAIDLDSVEVLVLDEADRMLDMGFWPQVERIVNATPETRQTLLFSATIDRSQDQTMFSILNDPAIVEIAQRGETADKVDQYVIQTTRRLKPELLNSFIKEKGGTRVIVFTKTKGCADNCTRRLRRVGIPTDAIHADRSQAQRSRALDSFRKGTTNVIVATDVLARGIDVPEVDYVVNYDLPLMPEDYVHRIGRTGRAGAGGFAVSFVTPDTKNLLKSIQKFIGQTIDVMEYKISEDAFEPLDNADPRVVAQGKAELEERAARKERERGRKGASMGEGKKGGKKKTRQRDKDRSAEFKRRKEAEAAGEEYIAPKRDHAEKGPRKPTLAERQAAAEEAFNAMFDMPNIPGEGSKKSKTKSKGGNGYSYAAFEKGKKHKGAMTATNAITTKSLATAKESAPSTATAISAIETIVSSTKTATTASLAARNTATSSIPTDAAPNRAKNTTSPASAGLRSKDAALLMATSAAARVADRPTDSSAAAKADTASRAALSPRAERVRSTRAAKATAEDAARANSAPVVAAAADTPEKAANARHRSTAS